MGLTKARARDTASTSSACQIRRFGGSPEAPTSRDRRCAEAPRRECRWPAEVSRRRSICACLSLCRHSSSCLTSGFPPQLALRSQRCVSRIAPCTVPFFSSIEVIFRTAPINGCILFREPTREIDRGYADPTPCRPIRLAQCHSP